MEFGANEGLENDALLGFVRVENDILLAPTIVQPRRVVEL